MHLLDGLPSVPLQYVGLVYGYWTGTGNRGTRGAKTASGKAGDKGEDGFGVGAAGGGRTFATGVSVLP